MRETFCGRGRRVDLRRVRRARLGLGARWRLALRQGRHPPDQLRFAIELDAVAGGEKLTRVRSRGRYFANISSTAVIVTSAALMPSGYAAISLSSFATAAGFGVA
jgi:hypothetical protein